MKKAELIFSAILVPIDYIAIITAGLLAYFLRFEPHIKEILPVTYQIVLKEYLQLIFIVALVWIVVFAIAGLYNIKGTRRTIEEIAKIFLACSAGFVVIVIFIFFQRELFSSRFIILSGWVLSIITMIIFRLVARFIQRLLFKRGVGIHRIILIGQDRVSDNIAHQISSNPKLGYKLIARFSDFNEESRESILRLIKDYRIDEIIQTDPHLGRDKSAQLVDLCNENHVVFKYAADLFDAKASNVEIKTIDGVPIIEVKRTPLDGWGRIIKRLFDIVGSSILIILASPIMILTALAIKLDSRGPIFFSNFKGKPMMRVGQGGKLFHYFKFRSMQHETHDQRYKELADQDVRRGTPMVKIKDDPRITRMGGIIRRFSIDELPEFFLVLFGRMSLVGPRPHLPEEVARYEKHHKKVLTIKPGITGMAQVSGRSDLDFEDEIRLDNYYIENWSILLDLFILFKTPFILLKKRVAL